MISPAQHVIRTFGGVNKLARLLNVHASTVCRWPMPREKGGLEGRVPQRWHLRILELARRKGLDVKVDDLVKGRRWK